MVAIRSRITRRAGAGRLTLAIVAAAAMAIAGGLVVAHDPASPWRWLHWACKPLATILILAMAWRSRWPVSRRYRRWILAGIACSLFGDVFLMLPGDLFVPGLLAFLLGHLCFIAALLGDSRFGARPRLLLASLGYGAVNLALLWDSIGAPLRMPVIVYVLVLACMGGQALARAQVFAQRGDAQLASARRAAVGAMLFMLSDSLLAWNRFHAAIPWSSLWVLSTYYLALWWIAHSVQRDRILSKAGTIEAGAFQ
ncbi:lysoplasmalogenase [Rhodanobacter glycinis]|uniref:Lysoplasmalogenase n=1 Tax=Rhodanobacter glycinis TaxID=582702 RepID=A0A502CI78_9GAMM|nr:lysoplasmalogenase [Rhodanobacter glycinis]TPG11476.1 lysoplasmalogenase [Rhodanobacter glycinis]